MPKQNTADDGGKYPKGKVFKEFHEAQIPWLGSFLRLKNYCKKKYQINVVKSDSGIPMPTIMLANGGFRR